MKFYKTDITFQVPNHWSDIATLSDIGPYFSLSQLGRVAFKSVEAVRSNLSLKGGNKSKWFTPQLEYVGLSTDDIRFMMRPVGRRDLVKGFDVDFVMLYVCMCYTHAGADELNSLVNSILSDRPDPERYPLVTKYIPKVTKGENRSGVTRRRKAIASRKNRIRRAHVKSKMDSELEYIYVWRESDSRYHKVGYSKDPFDRFTDTQIGNPREILLSRIASNVELTDFLRNKNSLKQILEFKNSAEQNSPNQSSPNQDLPWGDRFSEILPNETIDEHFLRFGYDLVPGSSDNGHFCAVGIEKFLHGVFATTHVRGEWFELSDEAVSLLPVFKESLEIARSHFGLERFDLSGFNDYHVRNFRLRA